METSNKTCDFIRSKENLAAVTCTWGVIFLHWRKFSHGEMEIGGKELVTNWMSFLSNLLIDGGGVLSSIVGGKVSWIKKGDVVKDKRA